MMFLFVLCAFQNYYKFHVPGCLLSTTVGSVAINAALESECLAAGADSNDSDDNDVTVRTAEYTALSTVLKQVQFHSSHCTV